EARRRRDSRHPPHDVDGLSGRGTLYPVQAIRSAGLMNPRWLPHYLADYDLAVRAKKAGYRLLVSEQHVVVSSTEFGTTWHPPNRLHKWFMVRSPYYLPALLAFWWRASSTVER